MREARPSPAALRLYASPVPPARAARARSSVATPLKTPATPEPLLDVLVVGAGLSGLTAAFELSERGADVVALDAAPTAGGVATSRRVGDYLFEAGPNTVPASARELRELAGRLGIASRLVAADPSARTRYLWFGGRLVPLPGGPLGLLTTPLLSAGAKLRVASEPLRRWRAPEADVTEPSLGELLDERIGVEASNLFAGAFVRGVYAGDHRQLGARSAFPRLWSMLLDGGGLVRGARRAAAAPRPPSAPGPDVPASRLLSFPEGLGELATALADRLGARLRTGCRVDGITREPSGWRATLSGGGSLRARALVLALGARAAAALIARAGLGELAERLAALPTRGIRLVHLGFAPGTLTLPPGFGYLVPPPEALLRRGGSAAAPAALGALFPSNLFRGRALAGGAAVTCFFAEDWARGSSPEQRAALARRDLAHALRLPAAPEAEAFWCVDWPGAIPQYAVEHGVRIAGLETELAERAPRLHLAGSYTAGLAVNQVLARGRAVAAQIQGAASAPPTP